MPPPGHEPFLRAICEAPDDDAPRLVYADWLEENGDPDRAEFIRVHIRLARDPDAPGIEHRCEALFGKHWSRWVVELPDTALLWAEMPTPWGSYLPLLFDGNDRPARIGDTWDQNVPSLGDWHRGFPATVYIQGHLDPFLSSAHHIADYVPVCRVRLRGLDDPDVAIQTLAGLPFLRRIRDLILRGVSLTDPAAIALTTSRFATGLRQVSLIADRMTDRAGRAFAESPNLAGVETLQLIRNQFSEQVRAELRARFGHRVHC